MAGFSPRHSKPNPGLDGEQKPVQSEEPKKETPKKDKAQGDKPE